MFRNVRIVGASFGVSKKESTYSGTPKYLFGAIEKKASLVARLNTKQLRPWDVFDGVVDFTKTFKYGRPGINVNWLWSQRTIEKLSKRFLQQLTKVGEFDTVLQTGTHVCVEFDRVQHYCITDMTVLQGIKAKWFQLDKLKEPLVAEAIEAQRSIFENCDGIFVASNWAKNSIVSDYEINSKKVFVVGMGASVLCDVDINNKRQNNNILFVGRDWERKGGAIAVEAFRKVVERIPDAQLTIVGCSPKVSHSNIRVLGYLDKTDPEQMRTLTECFERSTILCVPSVFDPFGLCFLEAQYFGVVPVTFAGEGRKESMKNGVTGVLVEERSTEALSETIIELLENPDKISKMSLAGYKYIRENYTWDLVAQNILNVIAERR